MKVPFSANTQNNSKPPTATAITPATAAAAYEPKSVLELCGSPLSDQNPLILVDPQLVDWNSFSELGLHDHHDPNSVSKPTIHQLNSHSLTQIIPTDQYSNQHLQTDFGSLSEIPLIHDNSYSINSFDSFIGFDDYVNELIQLAESIDTNSLQLGNVLLSRLNQTLSSPAGKPLQRTAFYFKEALQCLLTESTRLSRHPTTSSEIIQTIKAQKIFSTISPIPMFASFTANQAVLEAMDSSTSVHVIDFDIGLGGHWASFMKDLAGRAAPPPVLRISAVVCEEYAVESRLIRESLVQFSRELNIDQFVIDFISVRTFEYLSFRSIKFTDGEKVAVLLSPAIFHRVGTGFLNDLPRVSPHVVVHVDIEGGLDSGSSSCRQAVIDGLGLYSALLESLEAAESDGGGDWVQMIETFVVFPMIVEAVGRRGIGSREALAAAGLREAGLSQLAELQAECLVRRVRVEGFHVVKQQAEMLLCWHGRPIVATSAWKY